MHPRSTRIGLYIALFGCGLVSPLLAKPSAPPIPLGTIREQAPTEYPPPEVPEEPVHDDPFDLMPDSGLEAIGIPPVSRLPHLAHFRTDKRKDPFPVAARFLPERDLPAVPCAGTELRSEGACAGYLLAVEQVFLARVAGSEVKPSVPVQELMEATTGEPLATALSKEPKALHAFQAIRKHSLQRTVPRGILAPQTVAEQAQRLRHALQKHGVARLRLSASRGSKSVYRSLLVIAGRPGVGTMLSGRHRRFEAYKVVDPTLSFSVVDGQRQPYGMLYLDPRYGTVAFEPGDENLQWAFPKKRASPGYFHVFHPYGSPEVENRRAVSTEEATEDGMDRIMRESLREMREIRRGRTDG